MSSSSRVRPDDGLHGHRIHPANMLRAGLAEMVGTFFLIFTGTATAGPAALGKSTAGTPPDSLAVALAFGLVLVALVGALGQVSGAHLNGAVTLGLAVTRKFPWRYVPSYLGFQLLGAVLGAGATWPAFGSAARDKAHLGATVPATAASPPAPRKAPPPPAPPSPEPPPAVVPASRSGACVTVLEVLIALFLPPLAVAMKKGFSSKVLIALLLQLCGHIPGVIYGIYVVTRE